MKRIKTMIALFIAMLIASCGSGAVAYAAKVLY